MTALGRCQICGRRRGQRKAGGLIRHYVNGDPCPGEGHVPLDDDDGWLAQLAGQRRAAWLATVRELRDLVERRVNWIDPAIEARRDRLFDEADKLERRLKRHRAWPERFIRQMERDGMGQRPPEYLTARYVAQLGYTPLALR